MQTVGMQSTCYRGAGCRGKIGFSMILSVRETELVHTLPLPFELCDEKIVIKRTTAK